MDGQLGAEDGAVRCWLKLPRQADTSNGRSVPEESPRYGNIIWDGEELWNSLFLVATKAPWTAPVAVAVFETAQCQRPTRAFLTLQCCLQRYPLFTHGTKLDILSTEFPEHP